MSSDSPPPSYSPPRPPPPYESPEPKTEKSLEMADNEKNEKRESSIRIGPAPFVPLSAQPSAFMHPPSQSSTLVIVHPVKEAATSAPYQTFCPKCQMPITTRQHYVTGTFTWILVVVILIFFFPLAFVPFCLDSCKDVQHYCPKCSTPLSYRRKFF
ncbi:unnamed protein product, partial [Mesorhabditis belari]|uniref:LITAF domain-containing protein n=1 Tax=Mesorhabditis belari TaxID=2138241 RepID=A0AAF3FJP8_9BILA